MEKILIQASPEYDYDGNLTETPKGSFFMADVAPVGDGVISDPGSGVVDGNSRRLQLLTTDSPPVEIGDVVVVRGEAYAVIYKPWDWSHGRRPALGLHRPRMQIVCERGEA
ncbi:hypothetical protein [Corynebacterium ulcerans]|uniref:hypothetical protein n=1 Tax=Corynebacterium ulcerans TaxID=65058 RepID=UPI000C75B766|nr:hypothetical protein [Corynebacterium ulcerans]PLW01199.1 hypothetical protein BRL54_11400 [Corynebacterium ulcerans]